MAKKMYVGVDGVARKVKKMYIGVDGVARKVKKAYVGVGGVARPFFGGGELTYYGTITPLSRGTLEHSAATIGDYALFAGGSYQYGYNLSTVQTYNKSLTRGTATNLSAGRSFMASATVGDYALFAGGLTGVSSDATVSSVVDTYNKSLTKGSAYIYPCYNYVGGSNSNYALIAGGLNNNSYSQMKTYSFNTSLTAGTAADLSEATKASIDHHNPVTTIGDFILIATQNTMNAYDASLTKTNPTSLSVARLAVSAATVGEHALFAGGDNANVMNRIFYDIVDVYDKSLTRSITTPLSMAKANMMSVSVEGFALFAGGGGRGASELSYATVEVYDESLTRTLSHDLSQARLRGAATSIGNYALFAGGGTSYAYDAFLSMVDAYAVV